VAHLLHNRVLASSETSLNEPTHLITFDDVASLQQQNAKLLLEVQTHTRQLQSAQSDREQLTHALDELRVVRQQHAGLVDAVEQQRLMYRALLERAITNASTSNVLATTEEGSGGSEELIRMRVAKENAENTLSQTQQQLAQVCCVCVCVSIYLNKLVSGKYKHAMGRRKLARVN
jgi:hypothetical protein